MLTLSASETLVSDFSDLSIKNSILDGDYDSHKVSECVYTCNMSLSYANDGSNVACKKNFKNRRKSNKKNWKFNILHKVAGT